MSSKFFQRARRRIDFHLDKVGEICVGVTATSGTLINWTGDGSGQPEELSRAREICESDKGRICKHTNYSSYTRVG